MSNHTIHVVIPAAGSGVRLGEGRHGVPKQYQLLRGKPMLQRSVERFQNHPGICGITVAIAREDQRFAALKFSGATPVTSVFGGSTRAESVLAALERVSQEGKADWVLVHDAARPCISAALLDRLLEQGLTHPDGAILALPVSDTLKRQDTEPLSTISNTVDRGGLWAAQTPQLFPLKRLLDALHQQHAVGECPTDEAGAMEAQGARPLLVKGELANLKVTWPGDMALAEAILQMQSTPEESSS